MVFSLLKLSMPKGRLSKKDRAFKFDVHVLIYRNSELLGHEYLLNATPQAFTARMAILEGQADVSVTYEAAGALVSVAADLDMVDGNPSIRTETLQEWRRRDPQTVAQITGQYLDDTDEGDLSLWRL
ncbi:hypothetical protein C1752_04040 [Acaryochloris thomasi RCC1774]|uniref:Uncharacterized protein n=2 Tax=Acaryochloris TaxID=155977 RepID=A0A2W1JMN1_9CYAN|nr:hypothetical protein C1752_04040 [Acaryochloris thomasi RCC1774]